MFVVIFLGFIDRVMEGFMVVDGVIVLWVLVVNLVFIILILVECCI